ncbi:MAG: MMPL family transporter, partial [Deltaproteobacteria bacterium]|nr:MMPL family transporter [Deltaproteobacteria bacterium]
AVHRAETGSRDQAIRNTLRELIRPVALSSITTAVGFAVLGVSDMAPVRDLGVFAAAGMLIALACNLLFAPGVLAMLSPGVRPMREVMRPPGMHRAGAFAAARFRFVFLISLGLAGAGALLATPLDTGSNMLKFFPEDSRIARDYAFIGENLAGFYTLEMDLRVAEKDEEAAGDAIEALSQVIAVRPEVARVEHAAVLESFFEEIAALRPGGLPEEIRGLRDGFLQRYQQRENGVLHLRVSVLVRAMESGEFYDLLAFVRDRSGEILPPSVSWETTGVVSLLTDLQRSLIETQVRSLSMAAALIILMIGVLFRSLRTAAASILPNVLPILGVLGVMALAGVPLDPATVMIASVAIGIAADDTIHFLAHYLDARRSGLDAVKATSATLRTIGSALLFTSVVSASGFAILCLAPFRPIAHFGLLTGMTMFAPLAADLLVLPPCARVLRL